MDLKHAAHTLELAPTQVAEGAWPAGRRRRRRRHMVLSGAAAVLLAAGIGGVGLLDGPGDRTPPPSDQTPSATAGPEPHVPAQLTPDTTQRLIIDGAWRETLAGTPELTVDPARTVPLSERPLDHAVLAMADPDDQAGVLVLGDDGWWRRVETDPPLVPAADGGGNSSPALQPTSLSPDATKLALPQPQALVVVDLTTGTSERYDVPAFAHYAVWAGERNVFVSDEGQFHKGIVSVPGGGFSSTSIGPATVSVGDGADTLTWNRDSEVLDYYEAPDVPAAFANGGGPFQITPIVDEDVVVGGHAQGSRTLGSGDPPLGTGLAVLDRHNGDALAYLPISRAVTLSAPLGWRDGLPVLMLSLPRATYLVAWDWEAGELDPIAVTDSTSVSWGTGELP